MNELKLYQFAKKFNNHNPWKWLFSTDIFALKMPKYQDIYFCSVLGNKENELGLTIYKGIPGLVNLIDTFVKGYENYNEFLLCQQGFAVYFNDKADLPKEDYECAFNSGECFEDERLWPAFRVYKPGFYPVRPSDNDLDLIADILSYATDFVVELKQLCNSNESFFEQNRCYLREIKKDNSYVDKSIDIEEMLKNYQRVLEVPVAYDELSLARLKRNTKKLSQVWEISYFHYPYPVEQDGLIFYPINLLMVDTESQRIVAQHMCSPLKFAESFQKFILTHFKQNREIPTEMVTDNEDLFCYLETMYKGLAIKLTLVDKLFLIPHIKKQFSEMLEKQNSN